MIREDGTLDRTQRTVVLGSLTELSRREARSLLQKRVSEINQGRHRARPMMTLEKFARDHWRSGALLALKPNSAKYYNFQLDKHVFPALGSYHLCDVNPLSFSTSCWRRSTRGTQARPSMDFTPFWVRCSRRRSSAVTLKPIRRGAFKSARGILNGSGSSCHSPRSEPY